MQGEQHPHPPLAGGVEHGGDPPVVGVAQARRAGFRLARRPSDVDPQQGDLRPLERVQVAGEHRVGLRAPRGAVVHAPVPWNCTPSAGGADAALKVALAPLSGSRHPAGPPISGGRGAAGSVWDQLRWARSPQPWPAPLPRRRPGTRCDGEHELAMANSMSASASRDCPTWPRWPESNRRLPSLRAERSAIELQRADMERLRWTPIMAYEARERYYFVQSGCNCSLSQPSREIIRAPCASRRHGCPIVARALLSGRPYRRVAARRAPEPRRPRGHRRWLPGRRGGPAPQPSVGISGGRRPQPSPIFRHSKGVGSHGGPSRGWPARATQSP